MEVQRKLPEGIKQGNIDGFSTSNQMLTDQDF